MEAKKKVEEAAYHRLKDWIKENYPAGRFVAVSAGKVVADAASFRELEALLLGLGLVPRDTLIVQVGVDYSEPVVILFRPCAWVSMRFTGPDGQVTQLQLIADTGSPCTVVIGAAAMELLRRGRLENRSSNFGELEGGWLLLSMPELGLDQFVPGYASDNACQSTSKPLTWTPASGCA
jgi:hypothetical protein